MKILVLGDVHGCWADLNITIVRALEQCPDIDAMVQVGDFGYAWPGTKPFAFSKSFMDQSCIDKASAIPFYWLDGNHENHNQLDADGGAWQPGMTYQPRGSIREFGDKRAMFFGGASSIDKEYRIQDKSWWPQESITYGQILKAMETEGPIDIMFTHEHPLSFPYGSYTKEFGRADKQALDALREKFRPKWWFFGHHHDFQEGETSGTRWMCAPIIESRKAIIFDGEDAKLFDFTR